ncbi:MAG: hypothetical protein AAF962_08820 [Actinomycetota bacterium]
MTAEDQFFFYVIALFILGSFTFIAIASAITLVRMVRRAFARPVCTCNRYALDDRR